MAGSYLHCEGHRTIAARLSVHVVRELIFFSITLCKTGTYLSKDQNALPSSIVTITDDTLLVFLCSW